MVYRRFLLSFLFLILADGGAEAGTLANNGWSSSSCGAAPVPVEPDLTNPAAYNSSVEKVNIYRQKVPAYLDCVIQEANGDIQNITKSAKAAQLAAKEAQDKILAKVKAADEKFGK
jgi:hypothetical protein